MADGDSITYRFHLARGIEEITLNFEGEDFTLRDEQPTEAPDWTRLEFHQCDHCPLSPADSPFCPFAKVLAGFVAAFEPFFSYEEAVTEVVTKRRTVIAKKPLQHGMASLVGLIGATSGCPHLAFFRPMAKFHLPFAQDDETLYRVFSMHLLSRHLRGETLQPDGSAFAKLEALTQAATQVNAHMAERFRAAFRKDVVVNAIIVLDSFAQTVPYVIEERLDEFRAMFGLKAG